MTMQHRNIYIDHGYNLRKYFRFLAHTLPHYSHHLLGQQFEPKIPVQLNGIAIIQNNYDGSDPSFPYNGKFHVLVPPTTEVEVLSNINGATANMFVTMKAKVLGQ